MSLLFLLLVIPESNSFVDDDIDGVLLLYELEIESKSSKAESTSL